MTNSVNSFKCILILLACILTGLPCVCCMMLFTIARSLLCVCSLAVLSDLEWKIIYVGSAESEEYDQVLDSVLVGPVPAGRHMFVFQVS